MAQREIDRGLGFKRMGELTKFLDGLRESERSQGRDVDVPGSRIHSGSECGKSSSSEGHMRMPRFTSMKL
jgi:hypothetical protein